MERKSCGSWLKSQMVEPVIVFVYGAFMIHASLTPDATKYKMIRYYGTDPEFMVADTERREELYKEEIVDWNIYSTAVNFPIAILVTIALGALGDRYGRQINILWAITGLIYNMFGGLLVNTTALHTSLYWRLFFAGLTAFFGNDKLIFVSTQAFLSDTILNKRELTVRINILNGFYGIGVLLGTILTSNVYKTLGFGKLLDIGIGFAVLAFLLTLWRVPQVAPRLLRRERRRTLSINSANELSENMKLKKTSVLRKFLHHTANSFKETWKAFTAKRDGHKRFCLICVAGVQLITNMSSTEMHKLVSLFTLGGELDWDSSDYANYITVNAVLAAVGATVGIIVMKKILLFRDTTVTLFALMSITLSVIPMAVATQTWQMQLGNGLGCLQALALPTLTSFMASLVSKDEVGKVYTVFALSSFVADLMAQFVLQEVYVLTLGWFPGFMWVIVGILNILCFFLMLVVHILSKRDSKVKTEAEESDELALEEESDNNDNVALEGRNYGSVERT